jgi:hypothetical protein
MEFTTVAGQTVTVTPAHFDHLLSAHDATAPVDRTCIAYLCADCGTVGMAASASNVALLRENYDLTCCDSATTLLP